MCRGVGRSRTVNQVQITPQHPPAQPRQFSSSLDGNLGKSIAQESAEGVLKALWVVTSECETKRFHTCVYIYICKYLNNCNTLILMYYSHSLHDVTVRSLWGFYFENLRGSKVSENIIRKDKTPIHYRTFDNTLTRDARQTNILPEDEGTGSDVSNKLWATCLVAHRK
ncbi:hypothetical protein NHX12_027739 [Muraenolepis orangiensis]|uniref:Uncharacterized protein n=1 Tax=Muraenolepis orangiensis TaxID=630683 RepID=A0A9Q0IPI9_9TELE|nr:hypothetical protein NHX12_027739 [Muraenolepis orangiensis]